MRPSSSPSDLFGPMFGDQRVDRELDGSAWLAAMLDVERALARAQARAGLVPPEAADAVAAACRPQLYDAAALGRQARDAANPVVPLVKALTAQVPRHAAAYVHFGATSQDVLDTAAMLVTRRALEPVQQELAAAADACAALAEAHRDTILAARTLLQHALPTTFGLKCAGWLVALDEARAGLAAVPLAVQLGGAAGTLAAFGPSGPTVVRLLAQELDLPEPTLPWHTDRVRIGQLAGALGVAAGVLGKVALDVVLLAQTEVAEVAEPADGGRGGSSAMPHKRNPVGAVRVLAGTRRVPALVATLLAAMAQEHERAAGAWQAEWETLTEALRLVGGAAATTRELLSGLQVDAGRMRRNLAASGDALMSESVAARLAPDLGRAEAQELVRAALAEGRPLRSLLEAHTTLNAEQMAAALDPAAYLGAAAELVDRALSAHRSRR
ncbi:MAG: 3-carboxy-cis,cis-muconate cycloisomerase [Micromonosporaceae bacterium]|nr:3-carboxy-cis,cis-muconate cycloisomerase [Micromonosporaceae bacterium]